MASVKILVPLDGSVLAEKAVGYVQVLKSLGELEVHLVSALDAYEEADGGSSEVERKEMQTDFAGQLSDYLEGPAARLRAAGIKVETEVFHGGAAGAIIEAAGRLDPDLIVISTHGRTGFQRWRLGSVADKVIRGSNHNTLVIGPHLEPAGHAPRSVLVPLDGSPLGEEALPLAERYAAGLGATLHL